MSNKEEGVREVPLSQCFSTFFGSRYPFWVKIFGGTLTLINYNFEAPLKLIIDKFHSEQQENTIIGGTPRTFSWHPSVPRHPGWEPLL